MTQTAEVKATDLDKVLKQLNELQQELHSLRAEVRSGGTTSTSRDRRDDNDSDFSYLSDRKVDEVARFFRGMVHASLESVRVVADSVGSLASDAMARNEPKEDESVTDLARRMPGDFSRGIVQGIDDLMEAPRRAAERFDDIYSDPKLSGRMTTRRRRLERKPRVRSSERAAS